VNFTFFSLTENYSDASYKPDLYSSSMGTIVRTFGDYTVLKHTNLGSRHFRGRRWCGPSTTPRW